MIAIEQVNKLISMVQKGQAIYLPLNVPSKKNSKRIFKKHTDLCVICDAEVAVITEKGKKKYFCPKCLINTKVKTIPFIFSSALTVKYEKDSKNSYKKAKKVFTNMIRGVRPPYIIGYYFIRNSKRKFDYSNLPEVIQDQFTEHKIWEDDDMLTTLPVPLGYTVNKDNAGVILVLLNNKISINL